ncbi:replication factor C small subunit [archaeon]|nr:replication factor C small subunit [archaeon]
MDAIWVEKYRPEKVEDIVGQDAIVGRLKGYVLTKNMPNLLFAGPPGTGKTTAALALARGLFGKDWHSNFLELNASDERGIGVVRGKIKDFARTRSMGGDFKIIFLDEADALTKDAQNAMRRTMERYSSICRFVLSVNYSSKIIEPIQSRCAIFRYRPIKDEDIKERLLHIKTAEKLKASDGGIDAILYMCEGDLRKAINLLQSASAFGDITEEVIYNVGGMVKPDEIRNILQIAIDGDFMKAREALRNLVIASGVSGEDVVVQFHKEVFKLKIPQESKIKLVGVIGEYDFRIKEGASELIQLEALLAQFVGLGKQV